ncbi:hypothetical protein Ciccas_014504, partial [Cichlidogyrus casuarinus]
MLVGVYRPPIDRIESVSEVCRLLRDVSSLTDDQLFIIGDFNFPQISWTRFSSCPRHRPVLSTSLELDLPQIVQIPTRGSSMLDLAFVRSGTAQRTQAQVIHSEISDHAAVVISIETLPIVKLLSDALPTSLPLQVNFEDADALIANAAPLLHPDLSPDANTELLLTSITTAIEFSSQPSRKIVKQLRQDNRLISLAEKFRCMPSIHLRRRLQDAIASSLKANHSYAVEKENKL